MCRRMLRLSFVESLSVLRWGAAAGEGSADPTLRYSPRPPTIYTGAIPKERENMELSFARKVSAKKWKNWGRICLQPLPWLPIHPISSLSWQVTWSMPIAPKSKKIGSHWQAALSSCCLCLPIKAVALSPYQHCTSGPRANNLAE